MDKPAESRRTDVSEHIQKMVLELRCLEVTLGNLPPENWALPKLHKKVNDPNFAAFSSKAEARTEELFRDICAELADQGYSPEQIAEYVNTELSYPDGLKYCSEAEVREMLGDD